MTAIQLTAAAAEVAQTSGAGAPPAQQPLAADPAEARTFAQMMRPSGGAQTDGPGSLSGVAAAWQAEAGPPSRTVDELRTSMLQAYDPSDPMWSMFRMTDLSLEAHTMFTRLHVSSGLASAATSLFGTLLKNQQ
jgi:hypothetical protein